MGRIKKDKVCTGQINHHVNPEILRILILTVSWQTVRAATANPVEALRYE